MSKEVKLVIVGDGGVGKSTLVIQYVQNMFVPDYDPTIEDSYRKQDMIGGDTAVLDILDYCGQDEYSAMRDQYFRYSHGFLICFSLTNRNSIEEAETFIDRIVRVRDVADNERVPMIFVGTKSDLQDERQVTPGEIQALTSKYDIPYLETSAKLNTNVKEAFQTIAAIALESQQSELLKKNNKGQKKDVVCSIQ